MDSRWHLYQGALVWNGNPRQAAPTQEEARQAIAESGAMFARWTSNYDCGYPTEWWHCIKDTPFDLQKIDRNHRYKINKANKYFEVHEIDPVVYAEELYQVQVEAFKAYPKQYRPTLDKQKTIAGLKNGGWNAPCKVFAAFHRETGQMAGFTLVREREERVDLTSQKTVPEVFWQERECLLCEPYEKDGRYILGEVMAGGNFGHHDERIRKVGRGRWFEVFAKIQHAMHLLRRYPSEAMWMPVWMVYHFVWRKRINKIRLC